MRVATEGALPLEPSGYGLHGYGLHGYGLHGYGLHVRPSTHPSAVLLRTHVWDDSVTLDVADSSTEEAP